MLFRNSTTGQECNVSNLKMRNGRIFFSVRGKGCGARFFNRNTMLTLDEEAEDGTFLKLVDGWVLAKPAKPAKASTPAANDTPASTPAANDDAKATPATPATPAANDTPASTPAANDDANTLVGEDEVALLLALKRMRGGVVDEKAVEAIVERVLEKYASQPAASAKVQTAVKAIKAANKAKGVKVYHCKDYADILADVKDGFYPYLCGAAGCGKSHTAEQIANDLGLELYCQTTIQFAHDVKGYGTADGRLVETPFYKAFAFGGLYFQDEYDRSFTEAAVVLNTAVAQLYYDFPVVGRVYAHPNFRFMCAGNTRMKGADTQYTAAQPIDISSVDRVVFYECEYNHDVELNAIAKGDTTLVAFVEDARRAIASTGVEHVLSYRATKYMKARENNKEAALKRATFKALEVDEIRLIYGALKNKENVWAKAMANII